MEGKQVLLSGGTGGLGVGVAAAILARGGILTIPYLKETEVEHLKKKLGDVRVNAIRFVQADLSQEVVVERLINDLSRIEVLIHLVGGFSMGKIDEYSFEDWKNLFKLNLDTTFLVCKHSLRVMRHYGYGRIVTVGSRAALEPAPELGAYSAAKAAVVALTSAIARETKDTDITANCVLPSIIDTPANRQAMGTEQADKWVKPESLAEVICFLGSQAARDIRGAAVPVYGKI